MKRTLLSALTVLVASTAIAPIASAETASFNIQSARLEADIPQVSQQIK